MADQEPGSTQANQARATQRSSDNAARETGDASAPAQRELLPDSKLYYRIGEVSRITGIKPHVLRYWETEFRWMAPPKSRSKQRLYRRKDIEMVLAIKKLLYEERYTIAGARQVIRERGVSKLLEEGVAMQAPADEVKAVEVPAADSVRDGLPEQIRSIRRELLALRTLLA